MSSAGTHTIYPLKTVTVIYILIDNGIITTIVICPKRTFTCFWHLACVHFVPLFCGHNHPSHNHFFIFAFWYCTVQCLGHFDILLIWCYSGCKSLFKIDWLVIVWQDNFLSVTQSTIFSSLHHVTLHIESNLAKRKSRDPIRKVNHDLNISIQ